MKSSLVVAACALVLAACGKAEPGDTVGSLMADPGRLATLRAQCKADHEKTGDELCRTVATATRRRFMGDDKSPYASDPVLAAPVASAPSASAPNNASSH